MNHSIRRNGVSHLLILAGCLSAAVGALAQTVSIVSVTPSNPAPGAKIKVVASATLAKDGKTPPKACGMTLIPYLQGNAPSPIGDVNVPFVSKGTPLAIPNLTETAVLPATIQPGNYALEINCSTTTSSYATNAYGYIWAEKDVMVGQPPSITSISPSVGQMGDQITVSGTGFGTTPGYVELGNGIFAGNPAPSVYISGSQISHWDNGKIVFTLPETASVGTYGLQVQTASDGPTVLPPVLTANASSLAHPLPAGYLAITPALPGWVDLHAHPMSYLGFGGKLIYGGLDVGSVLPPEHQAVTNLNCFSTAQTATVVVGVSTFTLPVAGSEMDALSHEYMVHGGWDAINNPCGDDFRGSSTTLNFGPPGNPPPIPALSLTIDGLIPTLQTPGVLGPKSLSEPPSGYPTAGFQNGHNDFPTWPAWNDVVNQRMWVDWIRRAWQGGQRVMVALAVNNKALGDLASGPNDLPTDDKASADLQIQQLKAFVGRHSDFMQIALTPDDLSEIVSQGKMAIIIGTEIDNIGDLYTTSNPSEGMSQALTNEVDRLFGEGVRYIFPIHLVNNPIGATAAYESVFDVASWYVNGHNFWDLRCSQSQSDNITWENSNFVSQSGGTLSVVMWLKLGPNQTTPGPTQVTCPSGLGNVNYDDVSLQEGLTGGLTSEGKAAIEEMMNKGMLIDIDHMSQLSANDTIALAMQHSPYSYAYPLNSGHNGIRAFPAVDTSGCDVSDLTKSPCNERSFTPAQYAEIGAMHGMAGVGSAQLTADKWLKLYQGVIQAMGPGAGAGFGTDMDGMEFGMPNRSGSNVSAAYGTSAFPLKMSTGGSKSWNYDQVGVAHYGMLPDFLQDVSSLPGGPNVVASMNAGAQYFFETWRRATGESAPPGPALAALPEVGSFTATFNTQCPGVQAPPPFPLAGLPTCMCDRGAPGTFIAAGADAGECVASSPTSTTINNGGGTNVKGCNENGGKCDATHAPQ